MSDPLSPIVNAVAHHDVDVALVWGPVRWLLRGASEPTSCGSRRRWKRHPMSFSISMGVRKQDAALADEIDRALEKRQADIRSILVDYHVPSSLEPKSAIAE